MFFSLAIVFVLAGWVGVTSAAQNVANTTQKGSLLIFPKIVVYPPDGQSIYPTVDTYIAIGNDYYTDVWVKCYWVDENQTIEDFMFRLTPNQPIGFSAAFGGDIEGVGGGITVPPFGLGSGANVGELKCWAVNANGDQQIAFNHLYGQAYIRSGSLDGIAVYNAWAFTARGVAQGAAVGTAGNLQLTGLAGGYDACPQYLVTNFIPQGVGADAPYPLIDSAYADMTLVPCKQDLRQDRTPTCTKAKFDIWNANETKYTGAYRCLKCWYEGILERINAQPPNGAGYGGDKFTYNSLKTWVARFRVQGVASTVCVNKFKTPDTLYAPGKDKCTGGQVASPFLGVMLYVLPPTSGHPFEPLPVAAYSPAGAGADGSGFVLWDPQSSVPEAPQQ